MMLNLKKTLSETLFLIKKIRIRSKLLVKLLPLKEVIVKVPHLEHGNVVLR